MSITQTDNQIFFSKSETNHEGKPAERVEDLSLFEVTSVKVGRWNRLDRETDIRKVEVVYGNGRRADLVLFRNRKEQRA